MQKHYKHKVSNNFEDLNEVEGKNSPYLTLKNVIFFLHHVSHYSILRTHIVFYQVKFLLQKIPHIKNKHWPFMTYI